MKSSRSWFKCIGKILLEVESIAIEKGAGDVYEKGGKD